MNNISDVSETKGFIIGYIYVRQVDSVRQPIVKSLNNSGHTHEYSVNLYKLCNMSYLGDLPNYKIFSSVLNWRLEEYLDPSDNLLHITLSKEMNGRVHAKDVESPNFPEYIYIKDKKIKNNGIVTRLVK